MANRDEPQGFRPKGEVERANAYVAAGIIYPGDAVSLESGGRVVAASSPGPLCGVSASYASAAGDEVLVWDNPDQLFIVQASGSQIIAQTNMNLNYGLLATTGNVIYRCSRQEMNSAPANAALLATLGRSSSGNTRTLILAAAYQGVAGNIINVANATGGNAAFYNGSYVVSNVSTTNVANDTVTYMGPGSLAEAATTDAALSVDVSASGPLKLLGIEKRPYNELGSKVDCIVKINNHQLDGGTGTAGV